MGIVGFLHSHGLRKVQEDRSDAAFALQFLAAWLAIWLGRVLQEQVDHLKAENNREERDHQGLDNDLIKPVNATKAP
jgi:hypothetical protein